MFLNHTALTYESVDTPRLSTKLARNIVSHRLWPNRNGVVFFPINHLQTLESLILGRNKTEGRTDISIHIAFFIKFSVALCNMLVNGFWYKLFFVSTFHLTFKFELKFLCRFKRTQLSIIGNFSRTLLNKLRCNCECIYHRIVCYQTQFIFGDSPRALVSIVMKRNKIMKIYCAEGGFFSLFI